MLHFEDLADYRHLFLAFLVVKDLILGLLLIQVVKGGQFVAHVAFGGLQDAVNRLPVVRMMSFLH